MMKKCKILISLVVAFALMLCMGALLIACGNDGSSKAVTGVTLDKTDADKVTVEVGKTVSFTANVLPENAANKNVTWSIGEEEYATVDQNGVVTGKAIGFTSVIVTTEDGQHTASCDIQVTPEVVLQKTYQVTGKDADGADKTYNNTLTFYKNGNISLTGAVSIMTLLLEYPTYMNTYEVVENKITLTGSATIDVTFGIEMNFPLLLRQEKNVDKFIITAYVNNGTGDITIGEYELTKSEASSIGVNLDNVTDVYVTSLTVADPTIELVAGQGYTFINALNPTANKYTIEPAEAAAAKIRLIITEQKEGEDSSSDVIMISESVLGTIIMAKKAGTAKILVQAGGKTAEIAVTVTNPANPYTDAVKLDKEIMLTGSMSVHTAKINVNLGTDGIAYIETKAVIPDGTSDEDAAFMKSLLDNYYYGYYTAVKDEDTITQIKIKLFDDTGSERVLTYSDVEGSITITDTATENSWGTLSEPEPEPFATDRTFSYVVSAGFLYKTYEFKSDGTYTFTWVLGTPQLTETGTYGVVGDTIVVKAVTSDPADSDFAGASGGRFTLNGTSFKVVDDVFTEVTE